MKLTIGAVLHYEWSEKIKRGLGKLQRRFFRDLKKRLAEKTVNAFVVIHTADDFSKERSDAEDFDLVTLTT